MSFDKLHGEFNHGSFGYQITVIIRIKSSVDRYEIIRHDTTSTIDGTSEFLGLYFQRIREMNTVSIHQFTVVETFYQILVVINSTVVRFLDGTTRWSIIACNSQTNHGTVRQVDRTLHQSFAERAASYNNSSVPILYCATDDFTGRGCVLIHQNDKTSITEISIPFGIEITAFGSPAFGIYD